MEDAYHEEEKIRKALEEINKRPLTDQESKQAISLIKMLAEMAMEAAEMMIEREERLKASPNGFHLDGGGHKCAVCRSIVAGEDSWYDVFGIKCMNCQSAINNKIIPPTLCQKQDSYYTELELERYFSLKGKVLNNWIQAGLLIARVIPSLKKGKHTRLFLIKDNKEFLPPKHLVESKEAIEEVDGRKEYLFGIPWYQMVNAPIDYLKEYGIAKYLKRIEL
ncbi:hypothetical protein GWC95_07590 [Sediminibacterium roseum]|uniref:Uncharacterized protein n=1 Tax=Sediminibacterium roseum TaxID=1978412 RepID=A0ABW9ZS38_9BACT|nr:hypothetical protein [Sediminibacterium roseum]NCI49779.1 hypothetical protein [Sediminibacterium roseum]